MLKRKGKLKSKKGLNKSNTTLRNTAPIKKIGNKSQEWIEARKDVIEYFDSIGLPKICEAQLEGCTKGLFLTLAHSKKRRKIENENELKEVCLLCSGCHAIVDAWKSEHTEYYIRQLIEKRNK